MITVHSKPSIEPHRKSGWELVLWTGDAFDYSTPFRDILTDIAAVLNRDAPTSVELPGYEAMEDDVRGVLRFGNESIGIYYEHSLSYLSLMSESPKTLNKICDRLQPLVALAA
ncbi:MAG TPA: hypothetical protein VFL62_03705 [Bradyrhizobium sp.]|uniref:hypothetical protein n=1 Tax=Bradyrhizobium sp. TaxID=376 RepID=UPI002D7FC230|nr:hypothetical protein [Bradyrhizobium sp.]HET7885311.1 hypothetical protein [Bradyrhizobium sp.]